MSRPTPTIGFAVASRARDVQGSCQPAGKRLEAPESFDHSRAEPDVDVPEIDEVVGEPDEGESLVELDAVRAERVDRDAGRDGAVVADRLAHDLERLEPEAGAILEPPPYSSVRLL